MDTRDSRNRMQFDSLSAALLSAALEGCIKLNSEELEAMQMVEEYNSICDLFDEQIADNVAAISATATAAQFKLEAETAAERKRQYSKREVVAAAKARDLQNTVFATSADFIIGINRGFYKDAGIVEADVRRADHIWGSISIERARGATKTKHHKKYNDQALDIPSIQREVDFHIDLFQSCTVTFLIVSIQPIGMILLYALKNKLHVNHCKICNTSKDEGGKQSIQACELLS
jgi:hypothetical protein